MNNLYKYSKTRKLYRGVTCYNIDSHLNILRHDIQKIINNMYTPVVNFDPSEDVGEETGGDTKEQSIFNQFRNRLSSWFHGHGTTESTRSTSNGSSQNFPGKQQYRESESNKCTDENFNFYQEQNLYHVFYSDDYGFFFMNDEEMTRLRQASNSSSTLSEMESFNYDNKEFELKSEDAESHASDGQVLMEGMFFRLKNKIKAFYSGFIKIMV